jgi:hypothetical protein
MTEEELPIAVVADKYVPLMFRLKWKNGDLSDDFYNETLANDILKNYSKYRQYIHTRPPLKSPLIGA